MAPPLPPHRARPARGTLLRGVASFYPNRQQLPPPPPFRPCFSDSDPNIEARAAISAKLSEVGFLWARLDAQCRQWRRAVGGSPDSGPVMESSPVSRQARGLAGGDHERDQERRQERRQERQERQQEAQKTAGPGTGKEEVG